MTAWCCRNPNSSETCTINSLTSGSADDDQRVYALAAILPYTHIRELVCCHAELVCSVSPLVLPSSGVTVIGGLADGPGDDSTAGWVQKLQIHMSNSIQSLSFAVRYWLTTAARGIIATCQQSADRTAVRRRC
jgi:hypothetical protein